MIVVLDSEYPCAMGGPVLTAVDPGIFSLRYFTHCMGCDFCHDACCDHGVDIDVENAARLRALPKEFHDRVGAPAADWFTTEVIADREFPGGAHVRTAIHNGACIFRNAAGRGCTIHAYCLERDLDYHSLKPMVSVLFPVTFENGVLTASGEAADGSLVCAGTGPSLYDGARDELRHYFGDGLIAELDQLKANYD